MRRITASLILMIAVFFLRPSTASASLYGQAYLSYQETKTTAGGQSSKRSVFTQGYTIGGDMMLTSTISVSGDVRYTVSDTDGDKTDSTYPQVTLNYSPPSLANFTFGYTRTEVAPSDGIRLSTSSLSSTYSLPVEGRSSLALSFNRATSQDYETPRQIDTVATRFGLNTGYGLTFLETDTRFNYSFTHRTEEDNVGDEQRETPTHIVTADATRTFWDQKVMTNFNAGYSFSETKTTSLGDPSRFEEALVASMGLFSINSAPIAGSLANTQGLIDGNKVIPVQDASSVDIDLRNPDNNIGIQLPFVQGVHEVDLYIKTTDPNISSYVSTFNWQLYTSGDGLTWTLHASTVSYDPFLSRFRFTGFGEVTFRYFKVVNTQSPAATSPINVTEIEALGFRLETAAQTSRDDLTRNFWGFNLTVNPIPRLNVGYSLNYDHSAQSRNDTDSTSLSHGLNLIFVVSPQYLTVTTTYSAAKSVSSLQVTGRPSISSETETDTYTLAFTSSPLPTVNGNLSYNHIENMADGDKTSKNDSIDTSISLKLYRGVDVVVGFNISETEAFQSDSKTDTLNRYTTINLLPLSDLNIVVNATRSTSETENSGGKTKSIGKTVNVSASYTPTRRLYLSASLSLEPATSQYYAVTWMPSRTIQTSVNHGISDDFTNTGASINWSPLTNLTLFTGYNLAESKGATSSEVESLFARVSMRF